MANEFNLPKWANTVLTNEFEDDPYWYRGIETEKPEAYYAITNIIANPTSPAKYAEMCEIYDRYIDEIIDYYGGQHMIDLYIAEYDAYPPGYRDRPKLKLKKRNIGIAKSGVIPIPNGTYIKPMETEQLLQLIENEVPSEELNAPVRAKPASKKLRKRILKKQDKIKISGGRDRYAGDIDNAANYDVIINYFKMMERQYDDTDELDVSRMSIKQLIKLYDATHKDNDGWEVVERDKGTLYSGNKLLYSDTANAILEISKALYEQGFEKGLRKRMKKVKAPYRRFVESQLGINTASKKDLKKKKKQYKKYKKSLSERQDTYRSLAQSLSRHSSGIGSDIDGKIFDKTIKYR